MSRVARWAILTSSFAAFAPDFVGAQPAAPTTEDAPPVLAVERSPLLKEPTTPEEIFESTVLLVDLARFELAAGYLRQFVAGQPSDELLQQMRDKYGTATFVRFTRIPLLKADAEPLLQRLNEASRKQAEDPGYVDSLMNRLTGTALDRESAIRELRNAGIRAVPQILRRLSTTKSDHERDMLVVAMTRMGQPIVPAVIAGLDSQSLAVRTGCIEVLTLLESQAAVPRLWPLAMGRDVDAGTREAARQAVAKIRFGSRDQGDRLSDTLAVEELRKLALSLLENTATKTETSSDVVTVWRWDNAEQTLKSFDVSQEAEALQNAAMYAREAFTLSPERVENQTLYLLAQLVLEIRRVGWDEVLAAESSPVMQIAIAAGPAPLLDVLQSSLKMGRTDSAWAALQGLSALAGPELVQSGSPVLAALNYPEPRVQFSAAIVALRSNSRLEFVGASRVVDILRRALRGTESATAVIIHPDAMEAAQLGTFVYERGYIAEVARTGREGFLKTAALSGAQLVVVHANIANWGLTQTLSNLRADARTAFLPIVIYGPDHVRATTARLVTRTGNTVFANESPAASSFWMQISQQLALQSAPPISDRQRQDFKSLAVYWLAQLLSQGTSLGVDAAVLADDLLPLVGDETVSANVLTALGQIGSANVQSRLSEFALNPQLPLETRRAAGRELALHIPRYGLLLSAGEVAAVTTGWEQTNDPELKSRLAAAVGAFKPNSGLIGDRLRNIPLPVVP